MKAPFTYYGGKMGMAELIVSLMPEHRTYIEPFFGSGAVLFAKHPSQHEIINDVDGAVVNFFRVLREQPDELERVCFLTPHSRDEFAAADLDDTTIDPIERARRFWVRVNQSFGKTAGKSTGWSVTTSMSQSVPRAIRGRIRRFTPCAARLIRCSIEHCDAPDLVDRLATASTVIYADPPYPWEARKGRGPRTNTLDYRHDFGGPEDHRRLAAALKATDATVLLSGYRCPLYVELYDDWERLDLAVTVHSSNHKTSARGGRVESIWSNRPLHEGKLL